MGNALHFRNPYVVTGDGKDVRQQFEPSASIAAKRFALQNID